MLAEKYHHTLVQRLERIQVQWAAVEAAGKLLADRACAAGRVYVYDRMGAVMEELSFRAGGLMVIRPLDFEDVAELAGKNELGEKDVVLFSSYRADDGRDLTVADRIADTGAALVVLCPFEPEAPSGESLLKDRGDIAIDTFSGDRVGAIEVPGMQVKVCPTSGIADVMAAYAVLGRFVTEMVSRGKAPNVYMPSHLKTWEEYNRASQARFEEAGY